MTASISSTLCRKLSIRTIYSSIGTKKCLVVVDFSLATRLDHKLLPHMPSMCLKSLWRRKELKLHHRLLVLLGGKSTKCSNRNVWTILPNCAYLHGDLGRSSGRVWQTTTRLSSTCLTMMSQLLANTKPHGKTRNSRLSRTFSGQRLQPQIT